MRACIGIVVLMLTCCTVLAQESNSRNDVYTLLREPVAGAGKVEIVQPRKLAEALSNYHARNAQAVVTRVLEQFEGLRAYRTFDSPYYKVSVGDCRTRFEAYVLRQRLLSSYPRSFVVTERINFPATD